MEKITIDMPIVSRCDVNRCGYNVNNNCHAKAITVGDLLNPGCDTYFEAQKHSKETKRIAGVGACKIAACKHNNDFECMAPKIIVSFSNQKVNCMTYSA